MRNLVRELSNGNRMFCMMMCTSMYSAMIRETWHCDISSSYLTDQWQPIIWRRDQRTLSLSVHLRHTRVFSDTKFVEHLLANTTTKGKHITHTSVIRVEFDQHKIAHLQESSRATSAKGPVEACGKLATRRALTCVTPGDRTRKC